MRALIQSAVDASVTVDDKVVGKIEDGLVIYIGFSVDDKKEDIPSFVKKIVNLRIFKDENSKMNLSLLDTHKEVLLISQFTLCSDLNRGMRPSFDTAMRAHDALILYNLMIQEFRSYSIHTETGLFGAHMRVNYTNEGPLSFIYDKKNVIS